MEDVKQELPTRKGGSFFVKKPMSINRETLRGGGQKPEGWEPVPPEVRLKELRELAEQIGQPIEHTFPGGEITVINPTTCVNKQPQAETPAVKPPQKEKKPNQVNRQKNLAGLRSTFYKGIWHDENGVARSSKK